MKVQKVLAGIAVTALTASVAVGLTACGPSDLGKTTLNIKDYVAEENTVGYIQRKTPEVKNILTVNSNEIVNNYELNNSDMLLLNKGTSESPSYTVYSITYEKNILTNAKSTPRVSSLGNETVIRVRDENGDGTSTLKYYTLDGKEILSVNDYAESSDYYMGDTEHYYTVNWDTGYFYVDGEKETSRVNIVALRKNNSEGLVSETVKYFRSVTDEKTAEVSYEVLNASQLSSYGPEYSAGAILNGAHHDVVNSTEDKPVEGAIADYEVTVFGDTYTFYNKGTETGSLTIKNGRGLGVLDSKMYYYELSYVDSEATSGYNYVENNSREKYNYSLYCYDIVKNQNRELNYGVFISGASPLYNYKTKSYDAAVIYGYEMVDGVACSDLNEFTYVVDKDFKIAYDLHGANINSVSDLYDLGDGKYYLGNYIFDENLNVVNSVSSSDLYADEGLIKIGSWSGYGFTDLDGKIVIEPKYTSSQSGTSGNIDFTGGAAHVWEVQPDGTRKEALLKPDGTVTYVENLVKANDSSEEIEFGTGYYMIGKMTENSATIEIFANSGASLKKFTRSEDNDINFSGSIIYETDAANETTKIYKLIV